MTHSYGQRAGTRYKFARPFRGRGSIKISKYLATYKRGDLVDIIVDGSQHKGMPFHLYHGRTGRVFNVNPRSCGVAIAKQVGNRQIEKRLHIRLEHLRKSNCRDAFVARVKANDVLKKEAKQNGKKISTKRRPAQPREAVSVQPKEVVYENPKTFFQIV